jgi:acetylornithine/N-succinyldiaminopimelate aminotransferase
MASMLRARGNWLTDVDGKRWLDLQSGILNTPLGHGSATVSEALYQVTDAGLINTYDRTGHRADLLTNALSDYRPNTTWRLFNTGGEAIDKAVQIIATGLGKVPTIAVMPNAFHGKLLSMSWAHYGDKLPWGNPLNLITIDPSKPDDGREFDALIYEPVQGHGGTYYSSKEMRELANSRGAALIADEMITGFLRCGQRFMSEGYADIIVTGKGISGGAPLSAIGVSELSPFHGVQIPVGWRSTGVGNNLCATIGYGVLFDLIHHEDRYINAVCRIGSKLQAMGFTAHGAIGFKLLKDFDKTRKVFERAGVIASWHNAPYLRVGPSFVTTDAEMAMLQDVLEEAGEL